MEVQLSLQVNHRRLNFKIWKPISDQFGFFNAHWRSTCRKCPDCCLLPSCQAALQNYQIFPTRESIDRKVTTRNWNQEIWRVHKETTRGKLFSWRFAHWKWKCSSIEKSKRDPKDPKDPKEILPLRESFQQPNQLSGQTSIKAFAINRMQSLSCGHRSD